MKKLVLTLAIMVPLVACSKDKAAAGGSTAASASAAASVATTATTTTTATTPGTLLQKALSFVTGTTPFEGEITMNTTEGSKPPLTIVYDVKGKKMRFDSSRARGPAGDSYVIFDSDAKKMTTVTASKKMAFVMDMGSMPTAAAAQAAAKPTIDKTGKEDTVAGYSCDIWKITEADGDKADVCVAKGISFPTMGGRRGPGAMLSALGGDGFPLRAVMTDATGKEKSKMEVTKIEKKTLDEKQFEVPADYKTMNMGDMMKNLGGMHGMRGGMPGHMPH